MIDNPISNKIYLFFWPIYWIINLAIKFNGNWGLWSLYWSWSLYWRLLRIIYKIYCLGSIYSTVRISIQHFLDKNLCGGTCLCRSLVGSIKNISKNTKRSLSYNKLIKNTSNWPDVSFSIIFLSQKDFWSHVCRCTF